MEVLIGMGRWNHRSSTIMVMVGLLTAGSILVVILEVVLLTAVLMVDNTLVITVVGGGRSLPPLTMAGGIITIPTAYATTTQVLVAGIRIPTAAIPIITIHQRTHPTMLTLLTIILIIEAALPLLPMGNILLLLIWI